MGFLGVSFVIYDMTICHLWVIYAVFWLSRLGLWVWVLNRQAGT